MLIYCICCTYIAILHTHVKIGSKLNDDFGYDLFFEEPCVHTYKLYIQYFYIIYTIQLGYTIAEKSAEKTRPEIICLSFCFDKVRTFPYLIAITG